MSYNTDLQTNNTSLQTVLTSIHNLSSGRAYNTEIWELTMEDGSIVEESVQIVPIITFKIDFDTYQAIAGMTWGEWVNSEFNDAADPWCVVDFGTETVRIDNNGCSVIYANLGDYVKPEEAIQNGYEYETNGYFDFG